MPINPWWMPEPVGYRPKGDSSPIKVDRETNRIIDDCAFFLGYSKKTIIDLAVRQFIETNRAKAPDGYTSVATSITKR